MLLQGDPSDCGGKRGYKVQQVAFGEGNRANHTEQMVGEVSGGGSVSECGSGSAGIASAGAYGGLVVQTWPDPLGVPAIGDNEYVWSRSTPATLMIPASACAYAWGYAPEIGWSGEEVAFEVEPSIPTEGTRPGSRTGVHGVCLIAQTEDSSGQLMEGLVFRSKYLPAKNSDFGRREVVFRSLGGKVDYAEVEVFYPSEATNHPPGGPKGWRILDGVTRCELTPGTEIQTPNWFFYYWQACGSPERVEYVDDNSSYYCPKE